MNDDIETYLKLQRLIQDGSFTPEVVEEWLAAQGKPNFSTLGRTYAATLRPDAPSAPRSRESMSDQLRNFQRGGQALLEEGVEGAAMNVADNVVGLFSPRSAQAMRDRADERREILGDGVATAANVVGGMAAPGGAGAKFIKKGATAARRVGRGLFAGSVGGAVENVGIANPETLGEAASAVGSGAAVGAAGAGALGLLSIPAGRIARRVADGGQSSTVQRALSELGGDDLQQSTSNIPFATNKLGNVEAAGFKSDVILRDKYTAGIAELGPMFDEVDKIDLFGPGVEGVAGMGTTFGAFDDIMHILKDNKVLRAQAFPGRTQSGLRDMTADFSTVGAARRVRNALNESAFKEGNNASAELLEIVDRMENALDQVPGFREANAAYRRASEKRSAFALGANGQTTSGRIVLPPDASGLDNAARNRMAIASIPEHAQADFRAGMRSRLQGDLPSASRSNVPEIIQTTLDTPPGQRLNTDLRNMFEPGAPGDIAYNKFVPIIERDFRSSIPPILAGVSRNVARRSLIRGGR